MSPAGLLAEGKDRPERKGGGQEPPGEPGPYIHQQEIEGHQRERARGMRAGKAGRRREALGTLCEEPDVGPVAAETGEIPRAVAFGHELEADHDGGTDHDREHDEQGALPEPAQRSRPAAGDGYSERREADGPDDPGADAMNQRLCPPGLRADPALRAGVEEERRGDPSIEVESHDQRHCREPRGAGQDGVREP